MADILKEKGSKGEPVLVPHADVEQQLRPHRYRPTLLCRITHIVFSGIFIFALLQLITSFGIRPPRCHHESWASPFPHEAWPKGNGLAYEQLQDILQNTPTSAGIRESSKYYTSGPHLAGQNFSQALWTQQKWKEYGIEDATIPAYDIYINYPVDHRLALVKKYTKDSGEVTTKVAFEATLEEDVLKEDSTSGLHDRIPTFHGYSASGNVTAPFVYVNFGTYDDFEDLLKANVSLAGKIAIAKYGGIFRGLKVKRAQELGMVGCILYTDPQEDGEIIEANGYKAYPEGPARNPSAVQRGSVQFLSKLLRNK